MRKRDRVKKASKAIQDLNLTTKERLRRIIEDNDSKPGRIFDVVIQILIFLSILVYCLGTLPNLSPAWLKALNIANNVCYVVFTIEYFGRIYITDQKLKYIFSFYGIIDLLAILPFLFAKQFDLRAIRALRIFRIISALKISKYNAALKRFAVALKMITPELTLFFILTSIFIFLSAAGIYYFENEAQPKEFASIFHSLWWAIITLTTVGYGDIYPITIGGRAFTFIILLIGLGIITIPTGLIASALSSARSIELEENKQTREEVAEELEE
ncbi:ion transporter [Aequorivita capsosiphonis]|uniref:ion transporter n=1 Tax=Aequorivita capsosiphonis TaxID=487317 RepID=UPI0004026F8A|nr:ion transporter [Aequorivita capsosiphonis]